jgi:hypothetical protein
MRTALFPLIVLLVINGFIDYYNYVQLCKRCKSRTPYIAHIAASVLFAVLLIFGICLPAKIGSERMLLAKMWVLFTYGTVCIPKLIAFVFDLISLIPQLRRRKRWHWLSNIGCTLAIVTFFAMWWGALINRFNTQVNNVTIDVENLPTEFKGLTIAQFSDLHCGTYGNDTAFVSALVDQINALNADVIVFTGDIVNRQSDEMAPFTQPLSRLKAPMGVYAILGNHDYGDYGVWDSPQAKANNMNELYNCYAKTGIQLLLNETTWLHRGNDSIALIGVENIGDPPFKIYGSLPKAYPALADNNTKILLTHNPQHWVDSIKGHNDMNIALTLAGHTHAMQIEIAGISPAAWRYETWGGLYADTNKRQLYVNIGAGAVGFPMRLGATPEITLFTLRQAK